ncbi:transporter [Actinomyces sp. oral taxon 414]|uniref:cation diffusion facilitator family transporter n=1 Tax=Actinomyces sp. oral taxon 414 TaxID=712122 RepID=UPI0006ADC954|nr:cation diffusion facilitator family transporter [Actinomyces sp. oral taxon 414]ALC98310.1 transporter [Actinomyces sp. oral taxon 414]
MSSSRYAPPKDLSAYAWLSISAALATIALKGWAAWMTGSVGLLSDAAESVVNLVAAVIALVVLKISIRPADKDHQFGHSKAEYFSAIVEGTMIFVAAAFIIFSAIERLISPVMPERLGLGLAVSVVASLVNGAAARVLYRKGRRENSTTLVADAKHLATDVVTSAAVLVGVGLVAVFDSPMLDAVVALGAGLNIMWTGFTLIRDSVAGLMDIAPSAESLAAITAVLDRHRRAGVIDFHAVRVREAGNRRFADVHMLVPGTWSVKQGHDFTEKMIDELVDADPSLRVSAHLEPIEDPKSYDDVDDV